MNKLKMDNKDIENILETLNELQEDSTVPKNVKFKMQNIVKTLEEDTVLSMKINKVLNELDEIASDVNLQSYTRTQIWNMVSVLEKLQ